MLKNEGCSVFTKMDKKKSSVLVSICISTCNGAKFIAEALDTAVAQTYRPLEIVVSDDNSNDETIGIVKSYITKTDIPIKIYHHAPAGMAANWNHCIQKANGDYIKFLFQDDLIECTCVEEMMRIALEDRSIGMVFCRRKIICTEGDPFHTHWISCFQNLHVHWSLLKPIQHGRNLLKDPGLLDQPQNKVGEPVVTLIRKEVFNKIGLFNNQLVQLTDIEFYYRAFTGCKVAFIDKELASFRLHNLQASFKNNNTQIDDDILYPYLMYKNCFLFLHRSIKLKLLIKYHPLFLYVNRIRKGTYFSGKSIL